LPNGEGSELQCESEGQVGGVMRRWVRALWRRRRRRWSTTSSASWVSNSVTSLRERTKKSAPCFRLSGMQTSEHSLPIDLTTYHYTSEQRVNFGSQEKIGSRPAFSGRTSRSCGTSRQCLPGGVAGQFETTYSALGLKGSAVVKSEKFATTTTCLFQPGWPGCQTSTRLPSVSRHG
jgi:hypothetical protein